MSEPCKCKPNQPVLITIKTCNGNCKSNEGPYPKHDSRPLSASPTVDVPEPEPEPEPIQLPVILPREHGPGCSMEVSVLEKHDPNCRYKKIPNLNRDPVDDKHGSYDVIGRLNFSICNRNECIRGSKKSFNIQQGYKPSSTGYGTQSSVNRNGSGMKKDPRYSDSKKDKDKGKGCCGGGSGKNKDKAKEKDKKSKGSKKRSSTSMVLAMFESTQTPDWFRIKESTHSRPISAGPQPKRRHHSGDSCKLYDPAIRARELMALEKLIRNRELLEKLTQSPKNFTNMNDCIVGLVSGCSTDLQPFPQIQNISQNGNRTDSATVPQDDDERSDKETEVYVRTYKWTKLLGCLAPPTDSTSSI